MFKRINNLFHGFFSSILSGVERNNPELLLESEKENLRKQIANYNQGLAAHAALCERLMSQVKKLEKDEQTLRARTAANLRAGNRAPAGQLALRLQTVSGELKENRIQLEQAEKTYKELLRARDVAIKAAQAKLESLRRGIDDLKIKKATAELAEMASGMISEIGGSGDTLNRLQQMVEEERSKASGRARVARDTMVTTDLALEEAEQDALAEQALADFAAKEGLMLESGITSAPVMVGTGAETLQKSMGPQAQ
jgi:phage shock protein A